ncbi:MAG: hypothetical protein GXP28_08530 [Planctomycetes bacterium]|nr:hypothetical protein [Planctomycetota bacterium]
MATVHGFLPILAAARSFWPALGFTVLLFGGLDTSSLSAAMPPALTPVYWQQRLFFIPYQVNKTAGTRNPIAKVQLLVSQDGTTGWRTLQEAAANVRGFGYHAPEDGEYWFALRHLDSQGKPWPSEAIQPQMRIKIDTTEPTLQVAGTLGDSGTIKVQYESRDSNLRPESLVVEARAANGVWSRLQLGPPDVSQPDRLEGRASWIFPHTAKSIEIRASIADKAGHQVQSATEVTVAGPALSMPIAAAATKQSTADPFQAVSKLPSREWPANNRLPSPSISLAAQPSAETPPLRNPYTVAKNRSGQGQTSAQLIGDRVHSGRGLNESSDSGWAPPPRPSSRAGLSDRMVNSLAFDIEYDLESVGPWGVSKVELWGTHDDGQTWQSYTVDSDNRSPVRVSVPGEGVYGFRILVDGANGVGATPPRSGEKPELIVAVDLQAPRAELLSTELGQGNLADHLLLRWVVEDRNLEPRPIGLFYSTHPNGPWSTIASGLENTGSYTWRLQRHMPNQFYVRLEARDMAGNLATHQSPTLISLSRPQPTGHLRNVRPIGR